MPRGSNNHTYSESLTEVNYYQCPCGYKFKSSRMSFVKKIKNLHKKKCNFHKNHDVIESYSYYVNTMNDTGKIINKKSCNKSC